MLSGETVPGLSVSAPCQGDTKGGEGATPLLCRDFPPGFPMGSSHEVKLGHGFFQSESNQ